jgi:hypothetical protein
MFLAGALAALAMLEKFTALPLLEAIAAHAIIKKIGWTQTAMITLGFITIAAPILGYYWSDAFVSDVFGFQLSREGYDFFARLKLTGFYLVGGYASLLIGGTLGFLLCVKDKDKMGSPELFYSLVGAASIALILTTSWATTITPALYFASSSYALAILAARMLKRPNTVILTMFAVLLLTTTTISVVRIVSCSHIEDLALEDSIAEAMPYFRASTQASDYVAVRGFDGYYLPLLAGRRVVPELVDLNRNRLQSDLSSQSISAKACQARFIIDYEYPPGSEEKSESLLASLGISENERVRGDVESVRSALFTGSREEARFGRLVLYRPAPCAPAPQP